MTSTAPDTFTPGQAHGQSLASGAAGIALLRIEHALAGRASWTAAHALVQQAANGPVDGGEHASLYYGAPAVAFTLHTASADNRPRYQQALAVLDRHVARVTCRRLTAAACRIDAGEHAQFREYDLFSGLVGLGALLLVRHPNNDLLGDVLGYLVRLTRPRRHDGMELPGWWVGHDPDPILPTPGGHANFGMAHGAAGILALLALATRRGRVVEGQHEAIERLVGWFGTWRQHSPNGPWWPQWITRSALRTGRPTQPGPGRPSWCYGSIGIARALQLTALATGDATGQQTVERALLESLTERNLTQITEPGLCHGMAGLYQTVYRAARDSADPALGERLPVLAAMLARRVTVRDSHPHNSRPHGRLARGLLTGQAGVELTLETTRRAAPPRSGWDRCLLIT